jgi:hypothetical protein
MVKMKKVSCLIRHIKKIILNSWAHITHSFSHRKASRRLVKSISDKRVPEPLRGYLLENVELSKYKFHVYFNFSVPFAFSPCLIDKFLINPQLSRIVPKVDSAFDIFFSGELEDQAYISQFNHEDYKFHRKGTRLHVLACSNFFERSQLGDSSILLLMEKMAFHRINQFIMSYISKTNDGSITFVSSRFMDTNTIFYFFDDKLSQLNGSTFCLKRKPECPVELSGFEDFQEIASTAYEKDLVNEFTFTFYKRTSSWALFHNSLYTECIMVNVSFAEDFFCKSIISLSKDSDIDLIYKKQLISLMEDYLPQLFMVESFRKRTRRNDENKHIYNFFHYSYTLRNKVTHGRYGPSEKECYVALISTDNFIYFLEEKSPEILKNILNEYSSQFNYEPNIESEIEDLAILYPTLYRS